MERCSVLYYVPELPDPGFALYRANAGGDVRSAIWEGFEHLLRTLASLPPGSVTIEIRFCYEPAQGRQNQQERCRLYVAITSEDEKLASQVSALLSRGPLCSFYRFVLAQPQPRTDGEFHAACVIARRVNFLRPLYEPEFNARIPHAYLTVYPFVPEESNTWHLLDRVLGNLDEPVDICVRLEPTDVSHELLHHTAYLSRLHSVNRSFDEEEDRWSDIDYLDPASDPRGRPAVNLRPLRLRDPLADDVLKRQQRFHETLLEPHFAFDFYVKAKSVAVAGLVASTVAECVFQDGTYQLRSINPSDSVFETLLSDSNGGRVMGAEFPSAWHEDADDLYGELRRLPAVATVGELLGFFRLPIASGSSPSTMRKNTDPEEMDHDGLIVLGHDQDPPPSQTGSGTGERLRGLRLADLAKHFSIFGMPGTGKTSAGTGLLPQLNEAGIPFMVIETAKKEYRLIKKLRECKDPAFRKLAETLQVYTLGAQTSPLRLNPLAIPPGISRGEHIGNSMSCFRAAFPMPGPLEALISESLERLYDDHPDSDHPPVVADLIGTAEKVLQEKGYSSEINSDMRAALEVRLGSLARGDVGTIFQCTESVPSIARLMEVPSIIELDRLAPEMACLVTLFILTAMREALKVSPTTNGSLRLVIIIEEAHNVVGRNTSTVISEDVVDPRAHAAAYICRMLAELRALGVGMGIVDQLPSAVAAEVTKNTATKLAFREVSNDDRAELGGTMLFGDTESEEIARLTTGEAFFFTEGYHGPRRIRTINLHEKLRLPPAPSDAELRELLETEPWFPETQERRVSCELVQLREQLEAFDGQRLHLTRRLAGCSMRCTALLAPAHGPTTRADLSRLTRTVCRLKAELLTAERKFTRGPYRAFLPRMEDCSDDLKPVRNELVRRFESVTKPGIRSLLERSDQLIGRLRRVGR